MRAKSITQPSAGSLRYARPDRSHPQTTAQPPLYGRLRSSQCAASLHGSSQRSETGSLLRCLPPPVRCARGVVQLGEVRRQLAAVELGQRQTPERFVFRRRAGQQASGQLVVKAEQRVVVVARGGFAAPVRVAMSMISSGFWAEASIRPSASTRRPSASVFITSTFYRCGSE